MMLRQRDDALIERRYAAATSMPLIAMPARRAMRFDACRHAIAPFSAA